MFQPSQKIPTKVALDAFAKVPWAVSIPRKMIDAEGFAGMSQELASSSWEPRYTEFFSKYNF